MVGTSNRQARGTASLQDDGAAVAILVEHRGVADLIVPDNATEMLGRQAAKGLADAQSAIEEAEAAKKALIEFQRLVLKDWTSEENRVIGHVVQSPPRVVGAGPNEFTQDV